MRETLKDSGEVGGETGSQVPNLSQETVGGVAGSDKGQTVRRQGKSRHMFRLCWISASTVREAEVFLGRACVGAA